MWRVYVLSACIACVVAAATSLIVVRLSMPAPAPGPGGGPADVAGTVVLEGEAEVPCAKSREVPAELEVYYKTAFAVPPHLTFPEGLNSGCQVADQKAGVFKLRRTETSGLVSAKVKWKAEGRPAK